MLFVSQASIDSGTIAGYNLQKRIEAVKSCRKIRKGDLKFNDLMPKMKVDPETYVSKKSPSTFLIMLRSDASLSKLMGRRVLPSLRKSYLSRRVTMSFELPIVYVRSLDRTP